MKKSLLKPCLVLMCVINILSGCSDNKKNSDSDWTLIWSDEFNGKNLDRTKWDYQIGTGSQYGLNGWGNDELQYYTEDNAKVKDGNLIIEVRREDKEGMKYTSSRIRTIKDDETELFTTTYGKIEARIRLPEGNGVWPAFWMLPTTDKYYGGWPNNGEIDIMEAKGRLTNRIYGTLHYGTSWDTDHKYTGDMYRFETNYCDDFHVYAVEWQPDLMIWTVDGKEFYRTSRWYNGYDYPAPYNKPFYILLNLAIGGNFDGGINPDKSFTSASMYVDYVRVYQRKSGYNENVTMPETPKDTNINLQDFETFDNNSFVKDPSLKTVVKEASGLAAKNGKDWSFLNLEGGYATCSDDIVEGKSLKHFNIINKGDQNYSVQVLQYVPIIKGYKYCVEYDAKASSERNIMTKVGGDDDNSWVVYSKQLNPILTPSLQHYTYYFEMEKDTDTTARIEFNMGAEEADVWIGNITLKIVDKMGTNFIGVTSKKVPEQKIGDNFIIDSTMTTVGKAYGDVKKDESSAWYLLNFEGAKIKDSKIDESGLRHYYLDNGGNANWNIQIFQYVTLVQGRKYRVEYDAKATDNRTFMTKCGNKTTYESYSGDGAPEITTDLKHYSYDFTMNSPTDFEARLEFNAGGSDKEFWLGNISIKQIE